MALSVQTNNAAITALKNLNINNTNMNKSLTRLSTGFRINSAADDSSGFAVSSKLDAQTQRLKAASLNATQAQAMTKTADAGVNEIQNMIARIQVLATQASSANNAGELGKLDAERVKLESAINKIANSSNYNGVNLLNGVDAASTKDTVSGAFAAQTSVSGAAVTTFTHNGIGASYTVTAAADNSVTIKGSNGTTGTGTYSTTVTQSAQADTASGTISAGAANAAASALITGATLSSFTNPGGGQTFDIQVDAFGTVNVLDSNNTVVGVGLIDGTNVQKAAVLATAGVSVGVVAGVNTGITTLTAPTTARFISTSSAMTVGATGNNDKIQLSVGGVGDKVSFYDVTTSSGLSIAKFSSGASIALSTGGATVATGVGTSNLTIAANKGYSVQLSNGAILTFSTGAALDTINGHLGGSSGGTIDLANGTSAAAGTLNITLTGTAVGEVIQLSVGGTVSDLVALSTNATFASAGTIAGTGGNVAAATQGVTMNDGSVIKLTYAGSVGTTVTTGSTTLGASTVTSAATDYASALSFQVGADNNVNNQVSLALTNKYTTVALGLGGTGNILTQTNAQAYVDTAKAAMNTLIRQRADLGATQNQIGFIQANIATSIEQSMASVSSIRDTDMAAEMANFTKNKILTQAGTSMLAQANQAAQNILTLFR